MAPGKKSEAPADMSVTAGAPLAAEGGVLSALSKGDDLTSPISCGVTTEASLVSAEAASSGHCCLSKFLLSTRIFFVLAPHSNSPRRTEGLSEGLSDVVNRFLLPFSDYVIYCYTTSSLVFTFLFLTRCSLYIYPLHPFLSELFSFH